MHVEVEGSVQRSAFIRWILSIGKEGHSLFTHAKMGDVSPEI